MKRLGYLVGASFAAIILSACGGGLSVQPVALSQQSSVLPREAAANARGPRATTPCGTQQCIYVTNQSDTPSIVVYPTNANGNVVPVATISGSSTGLCTPVGVALDKSKNVWVADGCGSVFAFAAGANGNVSPIVNISGSDTQLKQPLGIFVGPKGKIFVLDGESGILQFASGANGNVAPISVVQGSNTQMNNPSGIGIHKGTETVANFSGNSLTTYPTTANGNVAPTSTISGSYTDLSDPVDVTISANGTIYVVDYGYNGPAGILVFAAGATGNVAPARNITGYNTGLVGAGPSSIAKDLKGNIYVCTQNARSSAVLVFAKDANGDVAPIRTISGSYTGLYNGSGITIG
jgi:hypothetical protein